MRFCNKIINLVKFRGKLIFLLAVFIRRDLAVVHAESQFGIYRVFLLVSFRVQSKTCQNEPESWLQQFLLSIVGNIRENNFDTVEKINFRRKLR